MKKLSLLVLIILAFAGFALPSFADSEPLILDVRTQEEWNSGHIQGAVLIPYDQIREKIGRAAKNKTQKIYIYCRTGRRSQIAKETLNALGYQNVVNLGSLEEAARILKKKIVK